MTLAADTTATIIPCLRYRDALAAIDWLCEAFGFEKHAVYADGDTVHHAQLVFGNGMVMLGSADNASEWGRQIAQPDEIGMRETQSACVIVAGRRRALRAGRGGRRHDRDRHRRPGLRRSRLFLPRPRGPPVVVRQLRPVEGPWLRICFPRIRPQRSTASASASAAGRSRPGAAISIPPDWCSGANWNTPAAMSARSRSTAPTTARRNRRRMRNGATRRPPDSCSRPRRRNASWPRACWRRPGRRSTTSSAASSNSATGWDRWCGSSSMAGHSMPTISRPSSNCCRRRSASTRCVTCSTCAIPPSSMRATSRSRAGTAWRRCSPIHPTIPRSPMSLPTSCTRA